jgi:hypothetical protein
MTNARISRAFVIRHSEIRHSIAIFLAHSFRLRDPWQCDCLTTGATRWSRVFHRPTGLEPDDALWLVCSGLPAETSVTLNGTLLARNAGDASHQYEVTPLITETNKVELVIPSDSAPPASPPSFPYDLRLGIIGHS